MDEMNEIREESGQECAGVKVSVRQRCAEHHAPAPDTADTETGAEPSQSCCETDSEAGRVAPPPAAPDFRAHFSRLCAEGEAFRLNEPDFDLTVALRDPVFVRMTAPGVGVPVADAWYALHRREYAESLRRESLEQAAAAVAAGSLRPKEGGRTSGGELFGSDPRHMSAAQRADLRERIKRGEKVYPG